MEPAHTRASLYLHEDMDRVAVLPVAGGCVALSTHRCPEKPTPNEDCALVAPLGSEAAVIAVADGLGGQRAGAEASRIALQSLASTLERAGGAAVPLRAAVLNGIEAANRAVLDFGGGAATTLALVEIQGNRIRPYHVGDSVILVVGQRGRMKWQTIPHSPVGFAVEAGVLDELEAMHHEDRHVVSNFLGSNEMRIEMGPHIELAPYDTLLIASDGLFDNLHLDEIVARVRSGALPAAVARLVADAQRRMAGLEAGAPSKPDDLTVLAFRRRPGGGC